ncbi:osmoprotectant ABC transporter ATP-binding subunit YehX [Klebsiella pneumoniae]|uniref:Osmoprotectant ABC transporter ATP-binding subunit YehX n=1 Tax=Klebsiella pneumoniae TaxID=573 RepID=A0A2X3EZ23_KLEPN|nr:osmoprotectant ABC transporter ATP-binding subunit YehX [Klebsiella pneumoniae]
MIEFQGVSKVFAGHPAVKDLTLELREGAFSVLVGTSGSGKSTTLKMINRLLEPDRGTIRFAGEDIRLQPVLTLRRRMGYAIQSIGLFPHWTVAQNIATVPQLQRWPRARIADRIDELMALLGWRRRCATVTRISSPAVSSSGWGWRGRWRQIRRCC